MNLSRRFKMALVFLLFFAGLGLVFWWIRGSQIEVSSTGSIDVKPLFLCRRGPETTVVDPQIRDADQCVATAKIQVIRYECTRKGAEDDKAREFLASIAKKGADVCRQFCEDVGDNCRSAFRAPTQCGFRVASKKAEDIGQRAGCGPHCDGTSFAYCSIYHAGFIQSSAEMLARETPNCRCLPASP